MIVRFEACILVCISISSLVSQVHCLPLPGRLNPADVEAKIRDDHELLHTVTYVGNNKVSHTNLTVRQFVKLMCSLGTYGSSVHRFV